MSNWPIFHEPWWLDAVAGEGNWGECNLIIDGDLVARLPWCKRKKLGFTYLDTPPLTQTLGPWFNPIMPELKYATKLAREKKFTRALLEMLPKHDFFLQRFAPEISNWLPWYWDGYKQTTNYTYRLENLSDRKALMQSMQPNIRGDIRKAIKLGITVTTDVSIADFIALNRKTFERQNIKIPYSSDLIVRLDEACIKNDARRIFVARDPDGRQHAGAYVVYNKHAAYCIMIGGDPLLRNSGATSLVLWEAIKFSGEVTRIFDFEGSMLESVERFYRGFGAAQTPYFLVSKTPNRMLMVARQLKNIYI